MLCVCVCAYVLIHVAVHVRYSYPLCTCCLFYVRVYMLLVVCACVCTCCLLYVRVCVGFSDDNGISRGCSSALIGDCSHCYFAFILSSIASEARRIRGREGGREGGRELGRDLGERDRRDAPALLRACDK